MSKFEIALSATLFGWLLAQGTEYIRYTIKLRSKKLAIVEEMREIKSLLQEGAKSALNSALSYGKEGKITVSLGSTLTTPVFNAFYHEVAHEFDNWQRYNIRTFYNCLQHYNSVIEWVQNLKSKSATHNEVIFKLFEGYKQASICVAYLDGCEDSGGKERITDDSASLKKLQAEFIEYSDQLSFKPS
ncbi:hypothetical protein ACFOZ5_07485 [Marinobacter lacisalsi]|uniref:DUF4760 domain-containing protein n=1 Tax=Marinobacter lacisalsi TaxID=475979 RepID=A0ABV8QES8_9GAMM